MIDTHPPRFLNDEPVRARAPHPAYVAWKCAARHRVGTATATLTLFVLTVAVIAALAQGARASRAESRRP